MQEELALPTPSSQYQDKLDPWSSHSIIRRWLEKLPPGTRVLDVGCATGTLGRLMQGRGLHLVGLEPEEEWARAARPLYQAVHTGTVETAADADLAGFDVIVLADVLEHLPRPEQTLARLVQLQNSGALFMISVPNIANLWVRLSLLFGRFDYTDRGILDRTHLHFFTRRTLTRFLADAGLRLRRLEVTPIPLSLVHPFFTRPLGRQIHRALAALTRALPTLLGYQFLAEVEKK